MTPPRDPDSGKGRVHTDYAGREVTRPGPHVERLDETPVEHLRAKVDEVADRVSGVEATIDMPSWDEFKAMRVEVAHCRDDRLRRERRAKWVAGAALTIAGSVVTGAVYVVRALNASSNAAAVAADRFDQVRTDVRSHTEQLKTIGETLAGHSAVLDILKRSP